MTNQLANENSDTWESLGREILGNFTFWNFQKAQLEVEFFEKNNKKNSYEEMM